MPKPITAVRIGEYMALNAVHLNNQMHYAVVSTPLGVHVGDDDEVYRVMHNKPLDLYFGYCIETKQMFELKKLI